MLVEKLVQQLRVLLQAVQRFEREIAELAPTLPDYAVFASFPGAGPIRPAPAGRLRRAALPLDQPPLEVQKYAGIAPVTERSGNKCWVHWRWQCPKFLRQTFVEWAALSIPHCYWAKAYYEQQRAARSHTPRRHCVRSPSSGFASCIRCWQNRTPYDEATYLNALKRHGSPLLNWPSKGFSLLNDPLTDYLRA